jgi:hypothetical protein
MTFGGVPIFDPSNPGNNPLALTVINVNGGKRMITAGTPYWLSVSPWASQCQRLPKFTSLV